MKLNQKLLIYLIIFTISGFSGLIYESIWSRYLKLFLGHASYAQMLVLIIFMGGMAIGSFFASKFTHRIKNLVLAYAIIELIVGLLGVLFHGVFTSVMEFTFSSIIPNVNSDLAISTIKFSISAFIILPQSILLGATFPILSAGIIRLLPENSGNTIAKLYFVNSLGAAIGILSNAFILVPYFGLPGAVLTAGLINIALAIVVFFVSNKDAVTGHAVVFDSSKSIELDRFTALIILVSCVTGLASFMYEIAWIRMLSMVLGASTDAFEIMLSTFILGLAIGSWFVRKKADQEWNNVYILALIQLFMGGLAALTIPMYDITFDAINNIAIGLSHTDIGYSAYNISSFVICAFIMLPTAICAGMTLPLITNILYKKHGAESVIGYVYSANTIGAIFGVLYAVQIIMPNFGLKSLILIGASLDVILGLVILLFLAKTKISLISVLSMVLVFCSLGFSSVSHLSSERMASGVYRSGLSNLGSYQTVFTGHGKTSTIAINIFDDNKSNITTNGKPDASIYINSTDEYAVDEPTMILAGAIPFIHNPTAKNIANIGFGSGLTSEVVLSNQAIDSLDTIEIEPKIIEAAYKHFQPKIFKPFYDSRSSLIIEDAKTFFTSNNKKYDIIIAEPSNPWVSGVSSLFTKEFYKMVVKYLNQGGIYAQWIQAYEINPDLVSTIYHALRTEFKYIKLYSMSKGDLFFVSSNDLTENDFNYFTKQQEVSEILSDINVKNKHDIISKQIADQDLLDYFFENFQTEANSDYFPILDVEAPKSRFKKENAKLILDLSKARLVKQVLGDQHFFKQANLRLANDARNSYSGLGHLYNHINHVFPLLSTTIERDNLDKKTVLDNRNIINHNLRLCAASSDYVISKSASTALNDWYIQHHHILTDINTEYLLKEIKSSCQYNTEIAEASLAFLSKDYAKVILFTMPFLQESLILTSRKTYVYLMKMAMSAIYMVGNKESYITFKDNIRKPRFLRKDSEYLVLKKMLESKFE